MASENPLNLQLTVAGVAVLMVLGGAVWFGLGPQQEAPEPTQPDIEAAPSSRVTVHVAGAVARPGVAVVASDARIADVIAAAGGGSLDADLSQLNLAAQVRDGQRILVPSRIEGAVRGQPSVPSGLDLNSATEDQLEELDGVGPVLARRIVQHRETNGPFETVEDLLGVPGIGEAKLDGMRGGIEYP